MADWKEKKVKDAEIINAALNRMSRDASSSGRTIAELFDDDELAALMNAIYDNHKTKEKGILGTTGDLTAGLVLPMAVSSLATMAYPALKTNPAAIGGIEGLANIGIGYGTAKNEGKDYTSEDATADLSAGMLGQVIPTIVDTPFTGLAKRGLAKWFTNVGRGLTTTGANALTPDAINAIRKMFPEEEVYGGD